ncbi:MAG TPA: ribonuclease III [Tahibacter sp.]|nr:ribonuclease III [Tahibacter sp.]
MKPRFPHRFGNPGLYEQALTHRSAARLNNERLEFLGDSLVNLLVAEMLYETHPRADEGVLTRLRAQLVRGSTLAEIARELELGDALLLGSGELKSGGFRRESILADALEALIAATYLDAGWEACRGVVRSLYGTRVASLATSSEKDPKTRLQEFLQAKGLPLPQYELVAANGEDHAKTFDVECIVVEPPLRIPGSGTNRRAAEQVAADAALKEIKGILRA